MRDTVVSKQLIAAFHASVACELEVIDAAASRVELFFDSASHRKSLGALCLDKGRDAIAPGVAELEPKRGGSMIEAGRQTK